jgi:hypothetical protein
MDAGRSLQQALDEGHPIDWRREFLRRKVPVTLLMLMCALL